jgi:tetratricopeptide (TPR) repeat protein
LFTQSITKNALLEGNTFINWLIIPSIGLFFGIIAGLWKGGLAFIRLTSLLSVLYRHGDIPNNYNKFMTYSSQIFLTQCIGDGYRFIHKSLQDYFVNQALLEFKNQFNSNTIASERQNTLLTIVRTFKHQTDTLIWLKIISQSDEDSSIRTTALQELIKCLLDSHTRRAKIYNELQNYKAALDNINQAIKLQPNSHCLFAFRAKLFANNNQYDLAIDDIDKALELKPKFYKYYSAKSFYQKALGETIESMNSAIDAIKSHPSKNSGKLLKAYIIKEKDNPNILPFLRQRIEFEDNLTLRKIMVEFIEKIEQGNKNNST